MRSNVRTYGDHWIMSSGWVLTAISYNVGDKDVLDV